MTTVTTTLDLPRDPLYTISMSTSNKSTSHSSIDYPSLDTASLLAVARYASSTGMVKAALVDELVSRIESLMDALEGFEELENGDESDGPAEIPTITPTTTLYTDYPITEFGDTFGKWAPMREVDILSYDGNKYVECMVIGAGGQRVKKSIKWGYLYRTVTLAELESHIEAESARESGEWIRRYHEMGVTQIDTVLMHMLRYNSSFETASRAVADTKLWGEWPVHDVVWHFIADLRSCSNTPPTPRLIARELGVSEDVAETILESIEESQHARMSGLDDGDMERIGRLIDRCHHARICKHETICRVMSHEGLSFEGASQLVTDSMLWTGGTAEELAAKAHALGKSRQATIDILVRKRGIDEATAGSVLDSIDLTWSACLGDQSALNTLIRECFAQRTERIETICRVMHVGQLSFEAASKLVTDSKLWSGVDTYWLAKELVVKVHRDRDGFWYAISSLIHKLGMDETTAENVVRSLGLDWSNK